MVFGKGHKFLVTHGMRQTRFYRIYSHMRERCNNPTCGDYFRYGGRGIKCLWNDFESFRDDMYASYQAHVKEFSEKDTTIERIDNSGNYCKENCRWATRAEQNRNQRKNRHITLNGQTFRLSEWEAFLGLPRHAIYHRMAKGFSITKAIESLLN